MSAAPTSFLFWPDADGACQRADVEARPLTVGADALCGVSLATGGAAAVHAAIARGPMGVTARRLTRVGALTVNGAEVEEHVLTPGDRLGVGDAELVFLEDRAAAPTQLTLTLTREDDDATASVTVPGARVVIGRYEGDVLVDDSGISGRHLEIENYGPGLCWARDLGSTNGSELNGEPLAGRRPLAPGDILRLGRILVSVEDAGPTPPNADLRPRTVTL